jgi:hypothetical protein
VSNGSFESDIEEISDHYRKYDEDWRMKPGERKMVIDYLMLKYSVTDICDAITGMFLSEHHTGSNRYGVDFTAFHYIFREHNFDKFRKLARRSEENARINARKIRERDEKDRVLEVNRNEMKRRSLNGFSLAKDLDRMMSDSDSE